MAFTAGVQSLSQNTKFGYVLSKAGTSFTKITAVLTEARQAELLSYSPIGVGFVRDEDVNNQDPTVVYVRKVANINEKPEFICITDNKDAEGVLKTRSFTVSDSAIAVLPMKTGETYTVGMKVSYNPVLEEFKPHDGVEAVAGIVEQVREGQVVKNYGNVDKAVCLITFKL